MESFRHGQKWLRRKEMTKEEIDVMYDKRLEECYQGAKKNNDFGVAFMILDKIRVMKLHMLAPAKEPNGET